MLMTMRMRMMIARVARVAPVAAAEAESPAQLRGSRCCVSPRRLQPHAPRVARRARVDRVLKVVNQSRAPQFPLSTFLWGAPI